jgi:phosphoglycerate kinase
MDKLTVRDFDPQGKWVFLRVDFNVPLEDGRVTDDSRIRAAIPTITYLLSHGARVVLASHLGRPDGKVQDGLRLRPVGERLSLLMRRNVPVTGDALGLGTEDAVKRLRPGEALLLENLRFHSEEENNDPKFAATLASYAEIYVNDAFGTAHRAHASTVGVPKLLPAYAGLLMEREITALSKLLEDPEHPFVAIVGGAKVSGKLKVLENLIRKVDMLILGGGMANTFLLAQGRSVGKSLAEHDMVDQAKRILADAQARGVKVILPVDVIVAKEVTRGTEYKTLNAEKIPASWHIVDVGRQTLTLIEEALADAKTVMWNGPIGVFEIPVFGAGTRHVARILADKADTGATVVVGGGDSVAAVQQQGLAGRMTHISTGGGASLEFLEGRELPGIGVLLDRPAEEPEAAEPTAVAVGPGRPEEQEAEPAERPRPFLASTIEAEAQEAREAAERERERATEPPARTSAVEPTPTAAGNGSSPAPRPKGSAVTAVRTAPARAKTAVKVAPGNGSSPKSKTSVTSGASSGGGTARAAAGRPSAARSTRRPAARKPLASGARATARGVAAKSHDRRVKSAASRSGQSGTSRGGATPSASSRRPARKPGTQQRIAKRANSRASAPKKNASARGSSTTGRRTSKPASTAKRPSKATPKPAPKTKAKPPKRPASNKASGPRAAKSTKTATTRKTTSKAPSSKSPSAKNTRKSMSKSTAKASVARPSKPSKSSKTSAGRTSGARKQAAASSARKRAPGGKSGQGRSKSRR